jgi:hypothetical protein
MGFDLQRSMVDTEDPQGGTRQEIEGYDGWGHDVGRDWRTCDQLVQDGFTTFHEECRIRTTSIFTQLSILSSHGECSCLQRMAVQGQQKVK